MRGLLHHYCGLELPEPAVFGLGAGLDGVYLSGPDMDPAVMTFGRTASMEVDVGRALGVDYREQPEPDDALAWKLVREEVMAGRPTMLTGDVLYLDYREYKVHFPAHRFVLLGFDDETEIAWIADRIRTEPEACSYGALIEEPEPARRDLDLQSLGSLPRHHDRSAACRRRRGAPSISVRDACSARSHRESRRWRAARGLWPWRASPESGASPRSSPAGQRGTTLGGWRPTTRAASRSSGTAAETSDGSTPAS